MRLSNNKIAFEVQFFHSYFKKDICDCLVFSATNKTSAVMKRYKMKMDVYTNGFKFFVNTQSSVATYLEYIENTTGTTYFDFHIETTNPQFYFFTDFPVNWNGLIEYDTRAILNTNADGSVELKATLSKSKDTPILATLRLYFSDILKLLDANESLQFKASFQSRATQWQYYIINNSNLSFNAPKVSGKNDIQFDEGRKVTIQDGREALLFSSGENLIPLTQEPKYKFDLVDSKKSSGNTIKQSKYKSIFTGLPNPNPTRIGIEVINDNNLVTSPMYVYV